MICYKII